VSREAMQMALDCMLHDGVPTDPEHPKRIAVNALIAALVEEAAMVEAGDGI